MLGVPPLPSRQQRNINCMTAKEKENFPMQNTPIGSNKGGLNQQLHNVTDTLRDKAEQTASEFSDKAKTFASDTSETAREYYGQASSWMQQNYGKTLGVIGVLGAMGLIGYFIGRNSNSSTFESQHHT